MKKICSPNLTTAGRVVRGFLALGLFIGAGFAFTARVWLGVVLALAGLFVLFEAVRGWCAVRACGIKTKL